MQKVLQPLKFLAVILMILTYIGHAVIIWLIYRHPWPRRHRLMRLVSLYSRIGLKIFNFKVRRRGQLHQDGVLFAGNHLSYLDVLVLGSQFPAAFVTSKEIQMTPFLGHICRLAACVFVDRQRRTNLLGEIQEITAALENGLNVMIFPEATSTNGEQILRFRRPLFAAAAAAQRPVVPFCINYRDLDGIPVTQQNRDTVCWYGDMSFLPHLWRLSGVGRGRVDLHILEPFHFTSDRDLTEIANFTHARVSEVFIKVPAS